MADSVAILSLLIALELVLGVDNILVISIFVERLPAPQRNKARVAGLAIALFARIVMLVVLLRLASLTDNVLFSLSIRDILLLAGGMFLLWKAVREIHATIELRDEDHASSERGYKSFFGVIMQIVLLDIVFSVDSVITAIGLTDKIWIIVISVMLSFMVLLVFAKPVGEYILQRPSLKILALSFLITIGITIFMEGMHKDVPKAYIYLPMGFALFVEILQLRYEHNKRRRRQHKAVRR